MSEVRLFAGIAIVLAGTFFLVSASLSYLQYQRNIEEYQAEVLPTLEFQEPRSNFVRVDCLGCLPYQPPHPPTFDNTITLRMAAGVGMYVIGGLVVITGIRKR